MLLPTKATYSNFQARSTRTIQLRQTWQLAMLTHDQLTLWAHAMSELAGRNRRSTGDPDRDFRRRINYLQRHEIITRDQRRTLRAGYKLMRLIIDRRADDFDPMFHAMVDVCRIINTCEFEPQA